MCNKHDLFPLINLSCSPIVTAQVVFNAMTDSNIYSHHLSRTLNTHLTHLDWSIWTLITSGFTSSSSIWKLILSSCSMERGQIPSFGGFHAWVEWTQRQVDTNCRTSPARQTPPFQRIWWHLLGSKYPAIQWVHSKLKQFSLLQPRTKLPGYSLTVWDAKLLPKMPSWHLEGWLDYRNYRWL